MSNLINPQDPVVGILHQAVAGLRKEVDEATGEMQEALTALAQGLMQHIGRLASRVAVLEARLQVPGSDPSAAPASIHEGGKEL